RREVAGDAGRRAADGYDDPALDVDAGEVVELRLGHGQSVPGEHQRRFDRLGGIDSQREERLLAERQAFGAAAANELETALRLDNLAHIERDRLKESVDAGR